MADVLVSPVVNYELLGGSNSVFFAPPLPRAQLAVFCVLLRSCISRPSSPLDWVSLLEFIVGPFVSKPARRLQGDKKYQELRRRSHRTTCYPIVESNASRPIQSSDGHAEFAGCAWLHQELGCDADENLQCFHKLHTWTALIRN